ncbi:uncharacterized protein V6R79_011631 [Siganus canaliculatus]
MKALSAESPRPSTMRRFSKPLMEKRRRERINHSLETLRLLMLENTADENLKNPKIGKAEILESVVHFLQTGGKEVEGQKKVISRGRRQTCARQDSYRDGVRSCLLRVSHFIANNNPALVDPGRDSHALPEPQTNISSPGHTLSPTAMSQQPLLHQHRTPHPYLTHCGSAEPFSFTAAPTHITDPVWRPWPQ